MGAQRFTIAVPTSLLWEAASDVDLVEMQRSRGLRLRDQLVARGVGSGRVVVFHDQASAREAIAEARDSEVVVVLQAMGVQPATTTAFLDGLALVPLVVFAALQDAALEENLAHVDIVHEGATVGTPMLTSVLVRRGTRFDLVCGRIDDVDAMSELASSIRGAIAASALRRARVAVIGREIPGYDCATVDEDHLTLTTGVEFVHLEPAEFREAFEAATRESVEASRSGLDGVRVEGVDELGLTRSLRAVDAVRDLTARHRCTAGVMNCHVADIRFSEAVGIAPCLALGEATTTGTPWTCAGDALTIVAMTVVKAAGFPTLYHELETVDIESGEFVVSNTGEHDRTWPAATEPVIRANDWYRSDPITGVCVTYELEPGPACIVAFAQLDAEPRFRFIVARGEVTARSWPAVGTVNGSFRFTGDDPVGSWRAWCLAGSNHHSVLSVADAADAVVAAGRHLGIEVVEIG